MIELGEVQQQGHLPPAQILAAGDRPLLVRVLGQVIARVAREGRAAPRHVPACQGGGGVADKGRGVEPVVRRAVPGHELEHAAGGAHMAYHAPRRGTVEDRAQPMDCVAQVVERRLRRGLRPQEIDSLLAVQALAGGGQQIFQESGDLAGPTRGRYLLGAAPDREATEGADPQRRQRRLVVRHSSGGGMRTPWRALASQIVAAPAPILLPVGVPVRAMPARVGCARRAASFAAAPILRAIRHRGAGGRGEGGHTRSYSSRC